ncbi:MAG TPA: autotransporter-associated beta strand repeat-containing protein [Pirellulales bacterium]|jgi:autotransporter-associated beta strand protein|nr:autotransporter-associated beta strand repeat-containing protein [Pirellulales bacterium]
MRRSFVTVTTICLSIVVIFAVVTPASIQAATDTWVGNGGDNNFKTSQNWLSGAAPTPGDILLFQGNARPNPNNNFAANTLFDGIIFDATATANFTVNGNAIDLNGFITDSSQSYTDTVALNLLLLSTPTISLTNNTQLMLSGNISGSGDGLNVVFNQTGSETGAGVLTLSGTNSFTGPVNVGNGATLAITSDGNLGNDTGAGSLVLNGGSILSTSGANFSINSSRGIAILNAGGATPPAATFNVASGQTVTYAGVISDNGSNAGLTKTSFGTIVLGGLNTYTGATDVANGQMTLDFTGLAANSNNIVNSNSTLTLGGANAGFAQSSYDELLVTGKTTGSNSQSFNNTNVTVGPGIIAVNNNGGSGTVLNLGALTHTAGGVAAFVLPSGTQSATNGIRTSSSNVNGIIGGWATISPTTSPGVGTVAQNVTEGTNFATVSGGNIVAYAGYTDFGGAVIGTDTGGTIPNANIHGATITGGPGGALGPTTNLKINANTNGNVNVDAEHANSTTYLNSISFNSTGIAAATIYQLSIGTGNTLVLGQTGAIFKQDTVSSSWFIGGLANGTNQTGNGQSQDAGSITAGGPVAGIPGEIDLIIDNTSETSGSLILESKIVDNNAGGSVSGGAVTLVKSGPGAAKIDGHSSYSGGTYILDGRLQLSGTEPGGTNVTGANPNGFGTGPVFIFPGAYAYLFGAAFSSSTINPVSNTFFIAGDGDSQEALGAIRFPSNRVNLTGPATGATAGMAIILTGNARIGGSSSAGGNGTALANANVISGQITDNGAGYGIDFGSGNTGIDTNLTISNTNNNYHGNTTIVSPGSGTNTMVHLGASNVIPDGPGFGNLIFGANNATTLDVSPITLDLNGNSDTVNGLSSGAGVTGTIIIENLLASTTPTLTVGNNDQSASFAGAINDGGGTTAITKIGKGIQTLSGSNNYSGPTNINGGTLAVTGTLNSSGVVNVNTSATSAGTLAGTGTVGAVTLFTNTGSNKAVINPGASGAATIGTLTVSSLTVNSGAALQFDFSGASSDVLTVQGAVAFNGASTITPAGAANVGTYTVLTSSSPITGTVPTLVNAGDTRTTFSYDSSSYSLTNTSATSIVIDLTGPPANLTWTGAADGTTWDLHNTANWTSTASSNPNLYFNNDNVTFADVASTPSVSVSLGSSLAPQSVVFTNTTGNGNSSDFTISGGGSIVGTASLTKSGTGTVTIATSNTYSGGTFLQAGLLNVNNNTALGTGTLTISGGTLGNTSGQLVSLTNNPTQTWTADITFNGPNDLNLGTGAVSSTTTGSVRTFNIIAGTLTIGGPITENTASVGITKNGNGTLVLAANSTFAGPVAINSGTVQVGNPATTGLTSFNALGTPTSITIAAGGALDIGGYVQANVTNGFGATPVTIAGTGVNSTGALTNSSTVSQQNAYENVTLSNNASVGGTGRFDIRGGTPTLNLAGFTLTKTGTNQFSITNATVSAGNIAINQGILELNGSTVVANDGSDNITVNSGATLQFFGNTGNIARPIQASDSAIINDNSGAGTTSTVASTIALQGGLTLSDANATATLNLNGAITQSVSGSSITKTGPGLIVLGNASNNYSGGTHFNGGTLQFAALASLGTGPLTFDGGAVQYPTGDIADDVSSLGITLNAGGGTVDSNGNTITLAHNITGVGGLSVRGNATITLTGTNNYQGTTTVQNGTLVLGSAGAFPTSTPLAFGDAANESGTLDLAGKSITVTGLTTAGTSSGTIGSSSNTLSVTLTYAAPNNNPNVFNGSIQDSVNGGFGQTTALTVSSGTLVLTSSSSYSGATLVKPSATLQLGNGASANSAGLGNTTITDNGSLVFSSGFLGINGVIFGTGTVTQTGAGTQTTLANSNMYQGGTILQGGILGINSDAAINNGVGGIQFNGGTLQFNGYASNLSFTSSNTTGNVNLGSSGTSTLNGNINTTGNFTYAGPSTLTLAGTVHYTGATNIQNGTLILGAAASLPTNTALTMGDTNNDSPTLDLNGHSITVSSLTNVGSDSPAIINNGTSNSTVIYAGSTASPSTFNGSLQSGGTNTLALQVNSGNLTLSGSSTYTGATTINSGAKLTLAAGNAITNTSSLVLNGGTLALGGNSQTMTNTTLRVLSNSTLDVDPSKTGTQLTLADSHTQSWSGVLRISDWTGNPGSGGGSGTDQILIANDGATLTGLTSQLNQIHFTGYLTGAILVANGSNSEIVPATTTTLLRGDLNQDGHVDAADIPVLEGALTNLAAYEASKPSLDSFDLADVMDINGDGKTTNIDVQALINLLISGGGSQSVVPEPASITLLGLCGLCSLACVRRSKMQKPQRNQINQTIKIC